MTARTHKRPLWRTLLFSAFVIGILAYGLPRFVTESYDYFSLAPCRDEIVAAIEEYRATEPIPDEVPLDVRAQRLLPGEHRLVERVSGAWCPTTVLDERAAFLEAMGIRIAFLDGIAAGNQLNYYDALYSSQELTKAALALYEVLGLSMGEGVGS